MPEKKFYITTSIAYTNAPPHLGFVLELVQADLLARYHRSLNEDVFFLTGADEHGIKIAKAAAEANEKPQDFTNKISKKFKELGKILNLSNDDFIRTTDKKRHWPAVERVWRKLKEKDDIYKKKYQGIYCERCEAFFTKKDLVNGKCPIHKIKPGLVEEENYFFRLSRYLPKIKEKIEKEQLGIIPETRKNEVLGYLKKGIGDISFSRPRKSLQWGIAVPGDSSQTIYVWADALSNYVSGIGYVGNSQKFQKYWPADVHCIGKDILKFHTLIWPAMLLSLGLALPKKIFVHGFITADGEKMSKSLGNVVDPFELIEKYGSRVSPQAATDAVRYFLLREIPASEDGDFTYEKFKQRYNSDLASGIGNLVARVSAMADKLKIKKFNPAKCGTKLKNKIKEVKNSYKKNLENFRFNEVLRAVWDLIGFCDKYIEEKKPWQKKEGAELVVNDLLVALDATTELLEPFLPETAEKIKKRAVPLFPKI